MIIILSPSKTFTTKQVASSQKPILLSKTHKLFTHLKQFKVEDFITKFKLSKPLAVSSFKYYKTLNPKWVCAYLYGGTAYKYLDAISLPRDKLKKLYILSAFYGPLNSLDAIDYYRLDIKDKLLDISLTSFWFPEINLLLKNKSDLIINLSSKEYSSLLDLTNPHIVTFDFREIKDNQFIASSMTLKKMRGLMARYLLINDTLSLEEKKKINLEGYTYNHLHSTKNLIMFIKESREFNLKNDS